MSLYQLQNQVRQNADELRYFYKDVKEWEDNMKAMDEQLLNLKTDDEEVPKEQSSDSGAEESKDTNNEDAEHCDTRKTAEKYKEKGNGLVKAGRWEEAIEQYDQAIKLDDNMAVYYGNRAYCYYQLKDLAQAEEDCTLALKLDSKYYKVLLRRAIIRRKLGNLVDAAIDLDNLLQMDTENEAAWKEYRDLYPQLKDLNCYNKLKSKLPDKNANISTASATETISEENHIPGKTINRNSGIDTLNKSEINKTQTEDFNKQWKKGSMQNTLKPKVASGSFFTEIIPLRTKPAHKRSKMPLKRIQIEDCFKK